MGFKWRVVTLRILRIFLEPQVNVIEASILQDSEST